MPYSPLQPRGPDGRFVSKGAIGAATRGMTGAKVKPPRGARKPRARRGQHDAGFKGLKANFVPYTRVNKRSQTAGFNAGTLIPGTHRRVVVGSYARIESTRNTTALGRAAKKRTKRFIPKGSKRERVAGYLKKTRVTNPALRGSYKGHEVRLGTSRGAGPTVIVRRGKHRTPQPKSMAGVNQYNKRINDIAGKRATAKAKRRKSRPQRRRAARRKKR